MRESGSIFTAGEIDLIGDHGFDFINVCAGNTQNRIDEIMAENDYFDGTMDDMLDNQAKLTALYKRNKTAFKAIVDLPSSNNPRRRSRGRRR